MRYLIIIVLCLQNYLCIAQSMFPQHHGPQASLFVHFDKNIYTNHEEVWFTAYFLNGKKLAQTDDEILSIALIRNSDQAILQQEMFEVNNGFSYGYLVLPDSLSAGDYHFLGITNKSFKGIPVNTFTQPITIKTNIEPAFNAQIKLLEPGVEGQKSNKILFSASTIDHLPLKKNVEVFYKYGKKQGKVFMNKSGEVIVPLEEQPDLADINVYAQLKYGKDSSRLSMALPVSKRKAILKFYPEGGVLVEGIPSMVAWEAKDLQNVARSLRAVLYKDNQIIDTIETGSHGMGRFMLVPESGANYKLKLLHSAFQDSTYQLPKAKQRGVGLSSVLAAARDTLELRITSKDIQHVKLKIYDSEGQYILQELQTKKGILKIKVPVHELPKGLKTVTVYDSLERPIAERLIFTNYETSEKIAISSSKNVYRQREKVTVQLQLKHPDSIAVVSIACVQNNRISSRWDNDIECYTYLNKELEDMPINFNGRSYDDLDYIENLLLVRGWRKYTWSDQQFDQHSDALQQDSVVSFEVNKYEKPVKSPLSIGLISGANFALKETDNKGRGYLSTSDLLLEPGKKLYAFVSAKNQESYRIHSDNIFNPLFKTYQSSYPFIPIEFPSPLADNKTLLIPVNEREIRLKEVNITVQKNAGFQFSQAKTQNRCGDYVCTYGILNCSRHFASPYNRAPKTGAVYQKEVGDDLVITVYQDCSRDHEKATPSLFRLPPIYTKKEFYISDYGRPLEPAYISTLYWNHALILNANQQNSFSFYTGDLTGKFSVIIQGITNDDVVYGNYTFEVKGK